VPLELGSVNSGAVSSAGVGRIVGVAVGVARGTADDVATAVAGSLVGLGSWVAVGGTYVVASSKLGMKRNPAANRPTTHTASTTHQRAEGFRCLTSCRASSHSQRRALVCQTAQSLSRGSTSVNTAALDFG
jgi:hypothetical protein